MRALLLVPLLSLALLSGCGALVRHDGDFFEASGTDPARFEADADACGTVAADYISYDTHGMDGTSYDRNRAFNAVYDHCMSGRGYAARPYAENWLPAG